MILLFLKVASFCRWIGTTFCFAWIMAQRWLQAFAYRVTVNGWVFILAGLGAVGIALVTVGYQSIRAAMANPVKNLRAE